MERAYSGRETDLIFSGLSGKFCLIWPFLLRVIILCVFLYYNFFHLRPPFPPPPPFPPQISTVNAWLPLKKWRKRFVFWEGSHDLKFWRFLEVVARCYRQLRLRGESQQLDWFNTEFSNSCWLFERFMWCFLKIVDVDSQHYLWQYFEDGSTQRSCVSRFRVPYK